MSKLLPLLAASILFNCITIAMLNKRVEKIEYKCHATVSEMEEDGGERR